MTKVTNTNAAQFRFDRHLPGKAKDHDILEVDERLLTRSKRGMVNPLFVSPTPPLKMSITSAAAAEVQKRQPCLDTWTMEWPDDRGRLSMVPAAHGLPPKPSYHSYSPVAL